MGGGRDSLRRLSWRACRLSRPSNGGVRRRRLRELVALERPVLDRERLGLAERAEPADGIGRALDRDRAPVARDRGDGIAALGEQLESIEREASSKALEQTRYNKTAAAKLLGMSFRALRYRVKKLKIE